MKNLAFIAGLALATTTVSTLSLNAPASATQGKATAVKKSWVSLEAKTDKTSYTAGQPIQVSLSATNTHSKGAYLRFNTGQRFDFSVYKIGESDTAYTWSASRMFPQMVGSLWLKPGQGQQFDATIGDEMGQLAPGKYQLQAHLTNSPSNIQAAPISFEVTAAGTNGGTVTDAALTITARTDKTTYFIGDDVKINIDITNPSDTDKTVNITAGLPYEVYVYDPAGKEIWNYTANMRFFRILGNTQWKAHETKSYKAHWNGAPLPRDPATDKLVPGKYQVQVVVQCNPPIKAAPVTIELGNKA